MESRINEVEQLDKRGILNQGTLPQDEELHRNTKMPRLDGLLRQRLTRQDQIRISCLNWKTMFLRRLKPLLFKCSVCVYPSMCVTLAA